MESLYAHIEEQARSYKYMVEIRDLFQKLRDQFHNEGDEKKALLAQYEVDAFNLMIKDGHVVALLVYTNEDGEEVPIADTTKFSEKELYYFAERLENTKNSRLKARYAHILWESRRKRQQYAATAIAAYLEQIPFYENLNRMKKNDSLTNHIYHLDILECVSSAFYLAVSSKQGVSKVASEIWRLIHNSGPDNMPRFSFSRDLMTLVLDNRKHFQSQDLNGLSGICLARGDQLESNGDLHGAIRMSQLGQRADQVLQLKTAEWNKRIAVCYEKLMETRKKSPMAAAEWCQRAIDFYKAAGAKAKVEELTVVREKLGTEMAFQEVSARIDQTDHIARCEQLGKEISNQSTEEILEVIAAHPRLLPLEKDMELYAKDSAKHTPFLTLIPESVMDDRMHVSEHAEAPEEKLKRGIVEAFESCLRSEKLPLINAITYHSFRAGKLDADKVIKSLGELSWIGTTLKSQRGRDKEYNYCWLDLIGPSIRAYFSYINDLHEGNEPAEPPIMAIDSITTKFEGLIRDYAQLNGMITCYDTTDKAGRTVTREKDLSKLLYDPRISQLFNADDLLYLRFMFIEHSGFTLRHRVAHSLMVIEGYNFDILQLLFVALMRLAKYKIKLE